MTNDQSPSLRTPLGRVRGLGSAKAGTTGFIGERLSGIALLALTPAAIIIGLRLAGESHAVTIETLGSPWIAAVVAAFLLLSAWHMRLGMQAIIEDYVQLPSAKLALLVLNWLFCVAIGAIGVFAILTILVRRALS